MLGISAREKQVLWLDYVSYIGDIQEVRVGAMVEDGLAFQPCGLCSKLYLKAYLSWLSSLVLYSTLLPKLFARF